MEAAGTHEGFATLAGNVLDDLLARRPAWATELGDHRFDDQLDDYSPAATCAHLAAVRAHRGALAAVDTAALTPEAAVDAAILADLLDAEEFALAELREHEWNPLVHLPGKALYALVARPFAPAGDRMRSLAGRLAALPDALATARSVLGAMPRVHVETARDQAAGLATLIRDDVEAALAGEPSLRPLVEPARREALDALSEFGAWLAAELRGGDRDSWGERDPRLGQELWERKLAHSLSSDLAPADLVAAAREYLDRLTEEITEAAAAYLGERASPDLVRRALDRMAADAPDDATVIDDARAALAEAVAFLAEADLVSPATDPIEIIVMPEFARGVAVAYNDPPGPLETAPLPSFYAIAPTPADWPAERKKSFYREYNRTALRNLTLHEAVPGHHLQYAAARRFRGPTRVRRTVLSDTFVEGWAVYAEQIMIEAGFGGRPARLQQLKMQLRMTINALLDHGVHSHALTRDDAIKLMTGRGFQEEGETHGKWRRALVTSTQLSTYFVGWREFSALRRDFGPGSPRLRPGQVGSRGSLAGTAGLRDFHDQLLAHGMPPPRQLRTLLSGTRLG